MEAAAHILTKAYDPDTSLFRGTGGWSSANGISALTRVSRDLDTNEFDHLFQNIFVTAQDKNPGFLNKFYDDEGWWALAWLPLKPDNKPSATAKWR